MAVCLLPGIDRHVAPERVERLLAGAERLAVTGGADHARARQLPDNFIQLGIDLTGRYDLVADQPPLRARALDAPLGEDRLARDAIADEARQAQVGCAGNDAFLA